MNTFNIRVYGILINDKKQILVSDELIQNMKITKFPGGGLEFGEGTKDCLRREFMEEMNLEIEVDEHIYTTDYFQISAFNSSHQIISIYYFVKALQPITVSLSTKPFDFNEQQMQVYHKTYRTESFRFIEWGNYDAGQMSLPIEKKVAEILKQK
jgi:8-oxo-dGTP diphosphatase